jgi:RNA polymerase sigma-70 factor (ECF subfamily)
VWSKAMNDDHMTAQAAIKSLYDQFSNDIYRYARLSLGNSSDAYDVVQEVFLRAIRSWDSYRQEASYKTWLMSITRNYMFDLFRKKRTERKFLSSYNPPQVDDYSIPIETIMEIEVALSQLKQNYRQVIILRHIENLSMQETGFILGWSEAKVRTTTHRAMLKLRKIMGFDYEEAFHNEITIRNT